MALRWYIHATFLPARCVFLLQSHSFITLLSGRNRYPSTPSTLHQDINTMAAYGSNAFPMAVSSPTNALQSPIPPRKNKPRSLEDLFPSKLYEMLEEVETLGLSAAVSWHRHGRAFIIKDKELFMAHVVPHFFKATKIRSFQRQCHLWGYKR